MQLSEAIGLHGASTNGGAASGMVMNKLILQFNQLSDNQQWSLQVQCSHLFAYSVKSSVCRFLRQKEEVLS